jgi:hypothetical protein
VDWHCVRGLEAPMSLASHVRSRLEAFRLVAFHFVQE